MEQNFDIVLPVAAKDFGNINLTIEYLFKNIGPRKIFVIASDKIVETLRQNRYCEYYNEDKIIQYLTLSKVKQCMLNKTGTDSHSGWYFQQFLKMAFAFVSESQYYLIWDSDTIPLNELLFFSYPNIGNNHCKCLFTMKTEYHIPYFKTINKLLDGNVFKLTTKSFIAEHMMIDKNIMLELIRKIENNKSIIGNNFWEKILYSIDADDIKGSGFSEYETYGNYVLKYYPENYNMRELRTLRSGSKIINKKKLTGKILNWISKSYDVISFEERYLDRITLIIREFFASIILLKIIPFKYYIKIMEILIKLLRKLSKLQNTNAC
jgi:hypothetical protein